MIIYNKRLFFNYIANTTDIIGEEEDEVKHYANEFKYLPEKLFVAIECLLNDTNEKVRLAAAITIFTVKRSKEAPEAKQKVIEN